MIRSTIATGLLALFVMGCGGDPVPFEISSSAFKDGERIPVAYTGEGKDVSPPLAWRGVPDDAEMLVLIVDDPDAPTPTPWVHWVLASLRPDLPCLNENEDGGGRTIFNSFGKAGYGGPMPPVGHGEHHYRFRLYALDFWVEFPAGGYTLKDLERGMKGHVIDTAELIGTYERE